MKNGTEHSGVLIDSLANKVRNKNNIIYKFISTSDMIAWKRAEKTDNKQEMKKLEGEINIIDIAWAERLNY